MPRQRFRSSASTRQRLAPAVTHKPDRVSIMYDGRIVKQGGPELVEQLEREGYGWVREEAGAAA